MAEWRRVAAVEGVPERRLTLAALGGRGARKVVLWREGERVFAVDNQCPHEGYPLSEGRVNGGLLTCDWHNFKYRFSDGVCVTVGEDVRVYPARVREGVVEVDVTEPPAESRRTGVLASLLAGVREDDEERAARDIARLLDLGTPLEAIAGTLARDASLRAPFGFLHAHAVVADALRLAREAVGEGRDPGPALLHAAGSVAEPLVRRPPVRWPDGDPAPFRDDPGAALLDVRRAAEEDRTDDALRIVRGAVQAGIGAGKGARWVAAAFSDHFLSFGHGAIFAWKALQLLGDAGWELADPLLTSLFRRLTSSTREDVLPFMRSYRERVVALEPELAELAGEAFRDDGSRPFDAARSEALALDGGPDGAFEAVLGPLRAGIHPDRIAAALVRAGAERILRFDARLARVEEKDFGWLDVTHVLTHANAVRHLIRLAPGPEPLRGLFHAAWFCQRTSRVSLPAGARPELRPTEAAPAALLGALPAAVRRRDPDGAARAALGFLACGGGVADLARALRRLSLEDCSTDRIVVDHDLKMAVAAGEEAVDPENGEAAGRILAAAARYLAADKAERFTARSWRLATEFVREGKPSEGVFQRG
jgi:nitrite reductase/ring-hydroxylating ferredoxin subunit